MKILRRLFRRYFYAVGVPILLVSLLAWTYHAVFYGPTLSPDEEMARQKKLKIGEFKDMYPDPSVTVRRPEVSHLVDGKINWTVTAESIEVDIRTGRTILQGSRGVFFRDREDESVRFEFNAPQTIYDPENNTVNVQGNVEGTMYPEMYEMKAQGMFWDEEKGNLRTGSVEVKAEDAFIRGDQLELSMDLGTLSLSQNVQAKFEFEETP